MDHLVKKKETIISAGIDIGTSTTKLLFSRFSLANMAGTTYVPKIEIVDTEVLYTSPIYKTPLEDSKTIDVARIEQIIRREYKKAGIQPSQVATGAVIITGETATKNNSREILSYVSNELGDFLVATAGPDLEAIIAAKGSGAYEYSNNNQRVIANVDIGGGTANIAVYRNKGLLGTCTMHIGGRLIEFQNGMIHAISPPVLRLIKQQGWTLNIGDPSDAPVVKRVIEFMTNALARILKNEVQSIDDALLLGAPPNWQANIDSIVFSGGIAECMYGHEEIARNRSHYNDIGCALADALLQNKELHNFQWIEPLETVRATVLGASTQITEISGATIQVDPKELPIKNLPVYHFDFQLAFDSRLETFMEVTESASIIYDSSYEGQNYALYISNLPYMGFSDIQKLCVAVKKIMESRSQPEQPIVLVLQTDYAKAIGQTLQTTGVSQSIICIDQVQVEHGDYLDIGKSLKFGVVPVVVKTLTFHSA
ncbi:MAG TPA: ethanolamine ammonia-lyase reactivating factor EutA [Rummeliibacillus sp.]|nr:ethanolamine ammonia-lyase reactivating factor EutA [Rummeliibacillus sp.]